MTDKELDEALARVWKRYLKEKLYEEEIARLKAAKAGGEDA